ncbi:MAG: ImmA/IrrE family metallo-endopeptidase [Candidatus Firestonebacteria bacterium]|nr:ImmA/IrrE family metallo-endopeptidase [Candidatus Firestonebacteria bacterium]
MKSFLKNLSELQQIGDEILEKCNTNNPNYEVDIDMIVEKYYEIKIESAPLKWEHGIEGYPCLSGRKIFIDSNLMNDDKQERRYRFTLTEEFAHIILHKDLWKDINAPDEWIKKFQELPDDIYKKLDNNAKELAGIILLPRYEFINRAIEIRNCICNTYKYNLQKLTELQKDEIKDKIIKILMDDFNVNSEPCEIRMERLERYMKQSLFEMILKSQYLKKEKI